MFGRENPKDRKIADISRQDSNSDRKANVSRQNSKNEKKSFISNSPIDSMKQEDMKKKLNLRQDLSDTAQGWITSSTLHALPRVFKPSPIYLRVIWLIFFLLSFGCYIWIVTNYFIKFFTWPSNTNIAIINESPSNFPAVTICNLNPLYKKRSQTYINNVLQKNNMSYLNNLTHMNPNQLATDLQTSVLNTIKAAASTDTTLNSTSLKLLGWDINEMLMSCTFNGNTCTTSDFVWFQTYDYGNCYTFNGNSSNVQQINTAGPNFGLAMELFLGDGNNDAQFVYETGAYVVIHNQSVTPLIENEGILAPVGKATYVSVQRTFTTNLPSPYSNCIDDNTSPSSYSSNLYKAIFGTLGQQTYRQKYCYRLCYQNNVIKDCNCYDSSLPNPFPSLQGQTINACSTTSQLSCLSTSKTRFQNQPVSSQCSSDCPPECSTIYYDADVSFSSYPTTFYSSWLQLQPTLLQQFTNNQTTSVKISGSVARINVYYGGMMYKTITQTQGADAWSLFGSVGGNMGLFIGTSLLSFIETLELIGELIRTCYVYSKKKRELAKVGIWMQMK